MKSLAFCLIIVALVVFFMPAMVNATTHTVSSGETLTSIAQRYGTTVESLKRANNLSSDFIREGQRLTIPGQTQSGDLYVVQWGETLSGIADKFGVSVSQIKSANNLSSDFIREGQRLAIPGHYPPPTYTTTTTTTYTRPTSTVDIPDEHKQQKPAVFEFSKYLPPPLASELDIIEETHEFTEEVVEVPSEKSELINSILNSALSYLGTPYVYGGIDRSGFDCSGLVYRVFGDHGIDLPRSVTGLETAGQEIEKQDLEPGDLLIFYDPKHVGIYIGGGRFIHSSSYRNRGVIVSSLERDAYASRYQMARRVIF